MISGIVVTIDKGGRLHDSSGHYIGFERGFGLVLLDMLLSALLVEFASAIVQNLLVQNLEYILAITSGMFLIFMLWFCHSFSYNPKKQWRFLVFLVLLIALNILMVYYQNKGS
jgi:hypothetical protein